MPRPSIFNIVGFAFARALALYPVQLHAAEQSINHLHSNFTLSFEQLGNISAFYRTAHSIIAREVNRLYEREGHVFAGRLRATSCEDDNAAEDKLFYSRPCIRHRDKRISGRLDVSRFLKTKPLAVSWDHSSGLSAYYSFQCIQALQALRHLSEKCLLFQRNNEACGFLPAGCSQSAGLSPL